MGLPTHPYLLLTLPDDPPSREVVRLSVGESDGRIEIGGTDHPESFDLRTLICAQIKGQTTEASGERLFCSEDEAKAAGWRAPRE